MFVVFHILLRDLSGVYDTVSLKLKKYVSRVPAYGMLMVFEGFRVSVKVTSVQRWTSKPNSYTVHLEDLNVVSAEFCELLYVLSRHGWEQTDLPRFTG